MPRARLTILVTDIVDSTVRAEAMGDRVWARVIAQHDAALRAVVAVHGGVTVKTLGDGVLATFAVPAQAVRAAAAMREAAGDLDLGIRVGLHAGEVDRGDDDVIGLAVHLASRIAASASAGEVLVSDSVRDLVGDSAIELADHGTYELKGFGEPMRLHLFVGESSSGETTESLAAAVPVPGELCRTRLLPSVGRDGVLRQMVAVQDGAFGGHPAILVVGGEPGSGKTRLCGELAHAAVTAGGVVLYGRCDDGIDVPFQPFVEALEHFVGALPPQRLRELLGQHAAYLTLLLPELPELLPVLLEPAARDPETERYRLFQAVAGWLATSSRESPILLVVDDLHWADDPTLRLLEHLAGRLDRGRVCVVLTCRDYEAVSDPRLRRTMAALARQQERVHRVELAGLTLADTSALVAAAYGYADGTTALMADAIHAESNGNPFVIGEVLRHLVDGVDGVDRVDRARSTGLADLLAAAAHDPADDLQTVLTTVREHIAQRITALPAPVRSMLEAAALVGRDFPVDVLRELVDGGDVATMLEAAVAARLVEETSEPGVVRYRFVHALVRATLDGGQSTVGRAMTHARIARAYESLYQGRLGRVGSELAHHWAEAAPAGYGEEALAASARAAADALQAQAYEAAEQHYEFALELYDTYGGSEARRVELRLGLTEAQDRGRSLRPEIDVTA